MDDKDIVNMYLERDETALNVTMEQYGNRLLRFAGRFLRDPRDAEECVSDTYVKTWNSIPPNRPDDLFAYLAAVCRLTAFKIIERDSAQKRSAQLVELTAELAECLPDRSTEDTDGGLSELVNGFLETLDKDKRAVFIGRYWYGESITAVSKRTGFSQSKVKSMLHRTRIGLKKYLTEKGVHL